MPLRGNDVPLVKFYYNDRGHCIKKETYASGSLTKTTYYVRDAAGSSMAVYEGTTPKENPIYGNNRLGVFYRGSNTSLYQLTDHLGNVRALVGSTGIKGASDYYPFGMVMPNRSLEDAEGYRYAYQGQEKDDETGKEAFELRLWDSRIGRWLSPDPYGQFHSPYLGMGNNPIRMIDPDGGYCYDSQGNRVPCNDLKALTGFDLSNYEGPTNESFYMLDGVVLGNSEDSRLGNLTTSFNIGGGIVYGGLLDNMSGLKELTLDGRFDPANSITFRNSVPRIRGNVYSKEASKMIDDLGRGVKVLGEVSAYAGYYGALDEFSKGNYASGALEGFSNYASIKIGASLGWVYGAGWSIGWEGGRLITNTEAYNRAAFGKYSEIYLHRAIQNNWDIQLDAVQIHLLNHPYRGNE